MDGRGRRPPAGSRLPEDRRCQHGRTVREESRAVFGGLNRWRYFCPILLSVPACSRLMFSRWAQNRNRVITANSEASARWPKIQKKIGVAKLATSADSDE